MRYFLGMEMARSRQGIVISQRKYVLDLLVETGMSECKLSDTLIDPNQKLKKENDANFLDKRKYQRLIGKLIYLSHTRPNIVFVVSVVSRYMHSPQEAHLRVVYRVL